MVLAQSSDRSLKADHAEGKLPLNPLACVFNILSFVSIFRLFKGPVMEHPERYSSDNFVRLEKDCGIASEKELLHRSENQFRFVILPTTSSPPFRRVFELKSRYVRVVRADHV